MAVIQCANGHLYDNTLYPSCPYCNNNNKQINFAGQAQAPQAAPGMQGSPIPMQSAPASQSSIGKTAPVAAVAPQAAGRNSEDMGKTVAPESYRKKQEEKAERDNRTVAASVARLHIEAIVGWLVCIEGEDRGRDYRLYDKQNLVGRSPQMDIYIENDKTISRENHARIAYDVRHNDFTLIPAESINNVYLNDEPVYTPTKMNAYDLVEFGKSKFTFVPFCTDKFTWDKGLKSSGVGAAAVDANKDIRS